MTLVKSVIVACGCLQLSGFSQWMASGIVEKMTFTALHGRLVQTGFYMKRSLICKRLLYEEVSYGFYMKRSLMCKRLLYEKSKIPFSYMLYAYSVKRAYRGTKPREL